ncbi:MAG: helix-turn-helix transcriptional regulator [Acidimicrobiales bacterium]
MTSAVSPKFVGRRTELDELMRLATTSPSDSTAILMGGEAGVGKTRLIEELTAQLDATEVVVSSGRCIPTAHGSLPFVAVIEALKELCARFDAKLVDEAMPAAPELALLLPRQTDDAVSRSTEPGSEPGNESQMRLFGAVSDLISGLAGAKRLCLVIEDLHWADKSTRDLFMFLVHSLAGSRAVVVGTYRSDEMSRSHPFRPVLVELDRTPSVSHLIVEPFDADEMVGFATAILGDAPTVSMLDELNHRSGGNAFFAAEILGALSEGRHSVRPELTDLILARIEALTAPTQELMRMFAVSGRSVTDELLEEVTQLDTDEIVSALREAIDQQVVVLDPSGPLYFRHALMQEAVYGTLLPRERQRAHARYAQALVDHPHLSATPESRDAELAWHYREARDPTAALAASAAAARSSTAVLAFPEALGHVETVLELWDEVVTAEELVGQDHCATLQWAAELADTVGYFARATQFQRSAISEAGHLSEAKQASMHLRLGRFLGNAGHPAESLAEYERAVASVPPSPSAVRAEVLAGYGQQLMLSLRSDDSVVLLEEAIAIARETGARKTEAHALNSLGSVLLHLGRRDEGVEMLWAAYDIAQEQDLPQEMLRIHVNLVGGLNEAGDLAEAERVGVAGMELTADLGMERGVGYFIASNFCETLNEMARWDEAAAISDRITRPEGEIGETWLLAHTTDALLRRGKLDDAVELLSRVDAEAVAHVNPQLVPAYWTRVADIALTVGDTEGASHAIKQGLSEAQVLGHVLTLHVMAIELDASTCESSSHGSAEADAHLQAMEDLFAARLPDDDMRSFRIHALLNQARAVVAQINGSDPIDFWRSSAEAWRGGQFAWHRARALYFLGTALVQAGNREDATAVLLEAKELCASIGAAPLHQSITQLIGNAGLDPASHPSEGAGNTALTPRELSVLRLVAEGRTNRQIGEELFISPKTVSVHISRAFQKLHVENRTEAAAAARQAGLI